MAKQVYRYVLQYNFKDEDSYRYDDADLIFDTLELAHGFCDLLCDRSGVKLHCSTLGGDTEEDLEPLLWISDTFRGGDIDKLYQELCMSDYFGKNNDNLEWLRLIVEEVPYHKTIPEDYLKSDMRITR